MLFKFQLKYLQHSHNYFILVCFHMIQHLLEIKSREVLLLEGSWWYIHHIEWCQESRSNKCVWGGGSDQGAWCVGWIFYYTHLRHNFISMLLFLITSLTSSNYYLSIFFLYLSLFPIAPSFLNNRKRIISLSSRFPIALSLLLFFSSIALPSQLPLPLCFYVNYLQSTCIRTTITGPFTIT